MDDQHKALVQAINDLHDAVRQGRGKSGLGQMFHFLRDYTLSHFRTEEELMGLHRYPRYGTHKEIHDALMRQMAALVQRYDGGQLILTVDVMDFLQEWLVGHIQAEDKKLAQFLREKGA